MISTYTPTKATQAQAEAYVRETERRWGQSGKIVGILTERLEDGLRVWTVTTLENNWDVWMRRNADGTETVYGEC